MIKVEMNDEFGEIFGTLVLRSSKGPIEVVSSEEGMEKLILGTFKLYLGDGESKEITAKDDPLDFIVNAYQFFSGGYVRASLPEFIEDDVEKSQDVKKN